jgi:Na+/H+ antiporter NhaD/arsenite permease-like protein
VREYIAIGVFVLVYFLIVTRTRFHIPIWTSMVIGAVLMVGLGVISIKDAIRSINLNVIAFLFGMFSIVTGLDKSGVLRLVAIKMISKAKSPSFLLMIFVVGMGLLSAFLVALIGVPLVIYISKHLPFKPVILLTALAFGMS